jgi:hypothetical protein
LDRRRFLASGFIGLDVFRRKAALFNFQQQTTTPREFMADIPLTSHHRIEADGVQVFYREAGPANGPVILLLHGFPTSSFQY